MTTIEALEAALINSSEFCVLEKETVIDAREIIKRLYDYKEGMHQLVKESKETISGLRLHISELENVNKMLRQEIYHKELKHLDDIRHCHSRISELEAQIKKLLTEMSKLRTALQTIRNDFDKNNQSIGNYSDGEYTQDYTTRSEMVFNALENL